MSAATTPGTTLPSTSRRARSTGLGVAGAGIVLFNIAPFMSWVDGDGDRSTSGYEADSLVPFVAYLGIGLLLAMAYAGKRARRGQHRGLTLTSMAVGIAATLFCIAYALDPMGALERGEDLAAQIGVYVGILGAALWSVGSGLLAKEIEGDDDERTDDYTLDASRDR